MLRFEHKTLEMTEINDVYEGVIYIQEIAWRGSGLTAGQRGKIVAGDGSTVAEWTVKDATENYLLLNNDFSCRGIRVAQMPDGSCTLVIRIR